MVQSILATGAQIASPGGGPAPASLRAQLQRLQQQLSDCVNCASAKTPEGKTVIQALTAKVSQVEQRISARLDAQATGRPAPADQTAPAPAPASAAEPSSAYSPAAIGISINVYA